MFQRRRARVLLGVAILLALLLVTVDFRAGDEGAVSRARGVVMAVLRPVQDGVATLVRPVVDAAEGVGELFSIRAENQRLRAEVERLEERRRVVADLERENAELVALLELAEREGYETLAARVVGLAPSGFEWTITIDVGADAGVERGMPVINGDGLVGRVIQTSAGASRVLLAIDPSFSAAARTARVGEIGVIDGRGGEPMVLRLLDPAADVLAGDRIVTSAYQGGAFPGGVPIGTVSAVGEASSRLTREVEVHPFVDFTRLHHVLVLTSTPVEDVPPLSETHELGFDPPPVPPRLERPQPDPVPEEADDTEGDGEDATGSEP